MSRFFVTNALAFVLAFGGAQGVPAQEKGANESESRRTESKVQVQTVFRMNTITGMAVRNKQGDALGQVEDLVIDLNAGDIRYAALSFGGFASLGDKLFAVPWKAMTFKFGEEDSYFIVDVTEEQLKRAPGFDQDKWPDMADPAWSKEVDAFFGAKAAARTERKTADAAPPGKLVYDAVYRGTNITGMKVKNDRDQELGSINELVVDIKSGKVRYAALSFGGVLGLGDKLFAIPWSALKFMHAATDKHFVLHVTPERLKEAEGFDEDHWPNTGDPRWGREIDEFYKDSTTNKSPATSKK